MVGQQPPYRAPTGVQNLSIRDSRQGIRDRGEVESRLDSVRDGQQPGLVAWVCTLRGNGTEELHCLGKTRAGGDAHTLINQAADRPSRASAGTLQSAAFTG